MQFDPTLTPNQTPQLPDGAAPKARSSKIPHPQKETATGASLSEGHTLRPLEEKGPPIQSSDWVACFSSVASTIGQGLTAATEQYLMPSVEILGRAAFDVGLFVKAASIDKKSLSHAMSVVLANHMEKQVAILPELEARRCELTELTGSTVCQELIAKLAARMISGVLIDIAVAPGMPENERSRFQSKIVQKAADGKSFEHTLAGEVIAHLVNDHADCMQALMEANLAVAFINIFRYIQEQQKQNPFFFVAIVQELFQNATEELHKLKPDADTLSPEYEKELVDRLSHSVTKKIALIAFPDGANSIVNPIEENMLTKMIFSKEALFELFETKLVPEAIIDGYLSHNAERTKDEYVLQTLQLVRELIRQKAGDKSPTKETSDKKVKATAYPDQEAFNNTFSTLACTLFSFFFDTKDFAKLGAKNEDSMLGGLFKSAGPYIVQALMQVDAISVVNKAATSMLDAFHKQEHDPVFPRREHEEVKRDIRAEFQLLAQDYELFRKAFKRTLRQATASSKESKTRPLGNLQKRLTGSFLAVLLGTVNTIAKLPQAKSAYKRAVKNVEKAYKQASAKGAISAALNVTERIRKSK